jgi:hypothetical protein
MSDLLNAVKEIQGESETVNEPVVKKEQESVTQNTVTKDTDDNLSVEESILVKMGAKEAAPVADEVVTAATAATENPDDEELKAETFEDIVKDLGGESALKDRTRDRIKSLHERVSVVDTILKENGVKDYEDLKGQLSVVNEFDTFIRESTATPEQFSKFLTISQNENSGDIEGLKKAYEFYASKIEELGPKIGAPTVKTKAAYEHFDNLRQRVEDGDLSEVDANELALLKSQQNYTQSLSQRTQEQSQERAVVEKSKQDVHGLLTRMSKVDVYYNDVIALLNEQFPEIESTVSPANWEKAVALAYDRIATSVKQSKASGRTVITAPKVTPVHAQIEQEVPSDPAQAILYKMYKNA